MRAIDTALLKHDRVLEEMVRRLVEAVQPERIYLFGSKARGEDGPETDYDLLVIVPSSNLPGYRRDQIAYRALLGLGVAKDVLVWTHDEFEGRCHLPASLPATVIREGKLLYAA